MSILNCWYAAIFESHASNPKLKTTETMRRLEINNWVSKKIKEMSRGESLSENQNIS